MRNALFLCAIAASPSAWAQGNGDRAAAAQVLFDQALALMDSGHAAEACPKLEASQALDPGMGTQYRLAECYETTGRLASAWALYVEVTDAAERANFASRAAVARRRASAIEPKLSRLTIVVPPALVEIGGLELQRNGDGVSRALWGAPVPVDGGEHTIRASAPRKRVWDRRVTVPREGATLTVTIPELEPAPPPLASQSPQRSLAPWLALGGLAMAAVGAGAALLAVSGAKQSDIGTLRGQILQSRGSCIPGGANYEASRCPSLLSALRSEDAFHDAAVGVFVAGGAAAAGALTYFVWPRRPPVRLTPAIGAGAASLTLNGSF